MLQMEKLRLGEVKGIAQIHVRSWRFCSMSSGFVFFPLKVLPTIIMLVNKKILSAV